MYLCVWGIDFASFYDFDIWFWNCFDSVVSFLFFIFSCFIETRGYEGYLYISTHLQIAPKVQIWKLFLFHHDELAQESLKKICLTSSLPSSLSWIFYSACSLKQQSADRHVASLVHIILIQSQPVFAVSPECCVLSGEAANTNFIVIGNTRSGLEPRFYRTRGEHANHDT